MDRTISTVSVPADKTGVAYIAFEVYCDEAVFFLNVCSADIAVADMVTESVCHKGVVVAGGMDGEISLRACEGTNAKIYGLVR